MVFAVVVLVFVSFVVANPTPYVSSPVYRREPLIGNYSFIMSSEVAPVTTDNVTYVVAYFDLNLAKVKPGDGFSLYVPMNKGSCVYKPFYGDPVVDVAVANAALFCNGSAWLLNFTARVTVPPVNCYGTAGVYLTWRTPLGHCRASTSGGALTSTSRYRR